MTPAPLILTALFDPEADTVFQALRARHFPAHLNVIPAHCTLFHHLPGKAAAAIAATLREVTRSEPPIPFALDKLRFLGRGVALGLAAPRLVALRAALAARWRHDLSAQDAQGFRPHVTVQNKVDPAAARALLAHFEATLAPLAGTVTGLALWHYRGGPWEPAGSFPFSGT